VIIYDIERIQIGKIGTRYPFLEKMYMGFSFLLLEVTYEENKGKFTRRICQTIYGKAAKKE
jgi:hypothetical protein